MIQTILETLSAFVVGALFGAWVVHLHREYIESIKAREARKSRE